MEQELFKFKFSIVMAVYNTEEYLAETLESILQQDIGFKDNVQLILVDDGSKDKSGAICDSYAEKYPRNIIVIHKENGGVSSARNQGLPHAEGRYLNFIDSDDKFTVNVLSEVYKFFINHEEDTDIVTIPIQLFDDHNGEHYLNYKFKKGNRIIDLQKEYDASLRVTNASFFAHRCKNDIWFDRRLIIGEDTKVVSSILYKKMKLGVVTSCKYLYRKRTGNNPSILQERKKKYGLYFDYFTYSVDWLLNFYREKFGFVPGYIQYITMIEFDWRIKETLTTDDLEGVLTAEEIEAYKKRLFDSFRYIDDIYILNQRVIGMEHKNFALSKKYNCYPQITLLESDAVVHYGNTFVCRVSEYYTEIESIKYKNDIIYLEGCTKLLNTDCEEKINVYMLCDGKRIKCNLQKDKNVDTVCFDEVIYRGTGFECQVPASDVKGNIKIGINFRGIEIISKNINFNKSVYITKNKKNSYYYTKGLLVVLNGNVICWSKCTSIERLGQEFLLLKEIWHGGKNGKGKAVARLNDNLKKLLHKVIS